MSDDSFDTLQLPGTSTVRPGLDIGPLGPMPVLSRRRVALGWRLGPDGPEIGDLLGGIDEVLAEELRLDRFEVVGRGAGLGRPAVVAQLTWPRLATRLGLGLEPAVAHAIVDRLLGFRRLPAEARLQVTPVEWGILAFLFARALDHLDSRPGPLGPWDLVIDRVGPNPFDSSDLGPIITWRWRVRLGDQVGTARLWLPESLMALWLADDAPTGLYAPIPIARYADLASHWKAEAGMVTLSKGLGLLRPGVLIPIDDAPLRGSVRSPEGSIRLTQRNATCRWVVAARPLPDSSAAAVVVCTPIRRESLPREVPIMPPSDEPFPSDSSPSVASFDIPVTLTVELGRVNIPLRRLADLKPGDVLELGRHAREPVELTSNGRTVARGELVQIETELGVRVTSVFL